jgi:hypothetical protein
MPEGWRPTKPFPAELQAKIDQWPPGKLDDVIACLKRWAANAPDQNGKGRKKDWDKFCWNWLTREHDERGQLSRVGQCLVRDYGNIKVVERHNRFRHFIDDKGLVFEGSSAGDCGSSAGSMDTTPTPRFCATWLLEYGRAYWGEYPSCAAVANYTQENRRGHTGGEPEDPDPRGERFNKLDQILRSAGRESRQAVHHITVDPHWFPDEDKAGWGGSSIRGWCRSVALLRAAKQPIPDDLAVAGELACDSDWAMLHTGVSRALGSCEWNE